MKKYRTLSPAITLRLTVSQIRKLEDLLQITRTASYANNPGMLLAQIGITGRMHVGFIHEKDALKIQEALGMQVGEQSKY